MDINKVASQIANLRKEKNLTQAELGDRVGVSFQAVSKWERGETLPDTAILPELAGVLETSIDNILLGGERQILYKGRITVSDMRKGLECLKKAGEYLQRCAFSIREKHVDNKGEDQYKGNRSERAEYDAKRYP